MLIDTMAVFEAYLNETDWMVWGSCLEVGVEPFFPPDAAGPGWADGPKKVCRGCPVLQECRTYAEDHDIEHGVFGGLSAGERRLRRLNLAA